MSYLSTILADHPTHYWRLAEVGGQLCHDIGSAPIAMNCAWSLPGYSGIASDGASMWASSNQGAWSGQGINFTPPFSWELWCWIAYNNGGSQTLIAHDGTAGSLFALTLNAAGTITFVAGSAGATSAAVAAQRWHHIVGTADATNANLYVDAIRTGPIATVGAAGVTKPFNVGARVVTNTLGVNAAFAEVATYAAVLSPSQVTAHFLAQEIVGNPVYLSLGTAGPTSAPAPLSTDIDLILASVRKSYIAP